MTSLARCCIALPIPHQHTPWIKDRPVEIFPQDRIRNFCIIAHIDHGKSTLADRFIEQTGTVERRAMRDQLLDTMDLERERGITIKLQPVSMQYQPRSTKNEERGTGRPILHTPCSILPDSPYILNLIDTPGHVDFTYEVSRSLAAVEGAILLVDASQGIQAQTLTTLHQAQGVGLTIIPVVNKIDLPNAEPELVAQELVKLLGCGEEEILFASGKTGEGVDEVLRTIVKRVPSPGGDRAAPLRALIFDSVYDSYRGVVSYVRVVDGSIRAPSAIHFMATKKSDHALEVGCLKPKMEKLSQLSTGMIGYIVTNVRDVSQARVGDTVTKSPITNHQSPIQALPGYKEITPMVYAGLFTTDGDVNALRDALGKLKLNDASLQYEPDSSNAFGLGFRAGFLGLLHLEIVTERLSREFNVDLIVTTPSVAYVHRPVGGKLVYSEPWVKAEIVVPQTYVGPVMELASSRRGIYLETEYLASGVSALERLILRYEFPLASIITNFYDTLKSASSGYASLNYELIGYREDEALVKLSVLVAGDDVEELGQVVHKSEALHRGVAVVKKLKELIPRQNFEVALQAALGGKIVARETISALRKDVTAKLYGGDRTRKDKLLKKQAEGKKKLKKLGRVDIPSDVFIQLLR
ncbi:elongation factor 4 [Candidatus Berkelbacteria bacterium]|nr:elongation factor 4 [Candidatus Berkelbacteria bacterium]